MPTPAPTLSEDAVWTALQEVKDPEIPVISLVELGVVRGVAIDGRRVTVTITPTFSGCPALRVMRGDLAARLEALGAEPEIATVLSPPWSSDRITAEGRAKLEAYGVAPPARAGDLIQLEMAPPRCPNCGSRATVTRNPFGPTLCKSLHTCSACGEPFEAFKTV